MELLIMGYFDMNHNLPCYVRQYYDPLYFPLHLQEEERERRKKEYRAIKD